MKTTKDAVTASGLTVLFEPEERASAISDIVFISGPGSHPIKTWQHSTRPGPPVALDSTKVPSIPRRKRSFRDLIRNNSIRRCLSAANMVSRDRESSSSKPSEPSVDFSWSHSRGKSSTTTAVTMLTTTTMTTTTTASEASESLTSTIPSPRQRCVLHKTNNNSNSGSYPWTTRSESKLLLATGHARKDPAPRHVRSMSRLRLATTPTPVEEAADNTCITTVYWPLDLLPTACPQTRIMTWGCQTLSTKGRLLPAQNNIFEHADDLLRELAAWRRSTLTVGRAVILVAHGLGGIMVKELLCLAEVSSDWVRKDILQSLSGVVFLGSPHRDGQSGSLGDVVGHLASLSLGIDANNEVLQDLFGVNHRALESGRQNFIRLWNNYNFRVKTFQEAQTKGSATSHHQAALRQETAALGDLREQCEAIDDVGPLDLAKFSSAEDPAYQSLSLVLVRLVHDEVNRMQDLTPKDKVVLRALAPKTDTISGNMVPTDSFPETGVWLYDLPEFRAWHQRSSGGRNRILWIKGRPGSGKSVLLKSLRGRVERQWGPLNSNCVYSLAEGETLNSVFFPGKQRQYHSTSPAGVYRSLLSQLYFRDPRLRKALKSVCRRSTASYASFDDSQVVTFFVDDYVDHKIETLIRRTFIFVDATDDCGIPYLEDLLYYLSQLAANSDYSICVATSSHPEIILDNAIEIVMHDQNVEDILRYVNLHFIAEWEARNNTAMRISHKAAGCFLWAEIVVSILNAAIEEGATEGLVEEAVAEMPGDIDGLYEWLFSTLSPEERLETLTLMQWVMFSPEPLRLNDLCTAIQLSLKWHPLSGHPSTALHLGPPISIRDLRHPVSEGGAFDSSTQFYSWVRSRSIGLLELQPQNQIGTTAPHEPQGLKQVRFIHESVRNFFLSGRGFQSLCPELHGHSQKRHSIEDFADKAHYSLMRACLAYLGAVEFEPLGRQGRLEPAALSADESAYWAVHARDQHRLVMSSYPFLQYAVDNFIFHLLSPRLFRYYLPQSEILRALSANQCRIWRRWTAILGCDASDAEAAIAKCTVGSAKDLLGPVFGTRYRLERIFRTLSKKSTTDYAMGQSIASLSTLMTSRRPPSRLPRLRTRLQTQPPAVDNFSARPQTIRSPLSEASPAMTIADTMLFSPLSPRTPNTPMSIPSPASIKLNLAMRLPISVE